MSATFLRNTMIVTLNLVMNSNALSHIGDPYYVFTKHQSETLDKVCKPDEYNSDKLQKYEVFRNWLHLCEAEIENTEVF